MRPRGPAKFRQRESLGGPSPALRGRGVLGIVLTLGSVAHDEPLAVLPNHLGKESRAIHVAVGRMNSKSFCQISRNVQSELYLLVVIATCRLSGCPLSRLRNLRVRAHGKRLPFGLPKETSKSAAGNMKPPCPAGIDQRGL